MDSPNTRTTATRWAFRCSIRGRTGWPASTIDAGGRTVRIPHDPERIQLESHGLPIHGVIGGRLAWELTRKRAHDGDRLSARLRWDDSQPELFEVFPFQHELVYEARLAEGRLQLDLTVHATGADDVPLAFGFHPYLCPPGVPREQWQIELPAMRRLALDAARSRSAPTASCRPSASHSASRSSTTPSISCRSRAASQWRQAAVASTSSSSRATRVAQVFAPRNAECICFEPMTAPANALRSGAGLRCCAGSDRSRAASPFAWTAHRQTAASPRPEGVCRRLHTCEDPSWNGARYATTAGPRSRPNAPIRPAIPRPERRRGGRRRTGDDDPRRLRRGQLPRARGDPACARGRGGHRRRGDVQRPRIAASDGRGLSSRRRAGGHLHAADEHRRGHPARGRAPDTRRTSASSSSAITPSRCSRRSSWRTARIDAPTCSKSACRAAAS